MYKYNCSKCNIGEARDRCCNYKKAQIKELKKLIKLEPASADKLQKKIDRIKKQNPVCF